MSALMTAENVCPAEAVAELMASLFLTEIWVPLEIVALVRALSSRVSALAPGTYDSAEREGLFIVCAASTSPKRML
jgi:hypothetical protein